MHVIRKGPYKTQSDISDTKFDHGPWFGPSKFDHQISR